MGVPAFFKWLTLRYPKIVIDAIDEIDLTREITNFLKNYTKNESSMPDIDNFYLDMNGIIHPCAHPQDRVNIYFIIKIASTYF
jgi:5'-3' exoribonuclease 2